MIKPNYKTGYLVYIIADRYKKTLVQITDEINGFSLEMSNRFSRLVYFEKFNNRKKAAVKKRLLEKSDKEKINKLVSKNNPEWLNIIFTLSDG